MRKITKALLVFSIVLTGSMGIFLGVGSTVSEDTSLDIAYRSLYQMMGDEYLLDCIIWHVYSSEYKGLNTWVFKFGRGCGRCYDLWMPPISSEMYTIIISNGIPVYSSYINCIGALEQVRIFSLQLWIFILILLLAISIPGLLILKLFSPLIKRMFILRSLNTIHTAILRRKFSQAYDILKKLIQFIEKHNILEYSDRINCLTQICLLNLRFFDEYKHYINITGEIKTEIVYNGLIGLSQKLNNPIYEGMVDPGLKSDVIQTLKIVTEKAYS
jgi:hypothetical protein